ncbi:DNA-directed RNA polymerase subunit delta [Sporolactobacillus spathodeae]|nr:DNA-directed RNA polymerase subunit delta [Sporolactobacillus spathodeae]
MFPVGEHVVERSKLDQMYDILVSNNKEPKTFYELTDLVFKDGEIKADNGETLARLYTTLSLDGRFLSVGHNLWALRNWYPLEQREDEVAKTLGDSTHRKNKVAEDGFDDYDDVDEEDTENEDIEDEELLDDEDSDDSYDDDNDDDLNRIRSNVNVDDNDEE